MTGMTPRSHGDRTFQTTLPLPEVETLAGAFRFERQLDALMLVVANDRLLAVQNFVAIIE